MSSFLKAHKSITILCILIIFQMILISLQVPLDSKESLFERVIFNIFAPIQHGVVSSFRWIGNTWKGYIDLRGAHKRNQELNREIFRLSLENDLLRSALQKWREEEELADLHRSHQDFIIPARIIGVDSSVAFSSVVLNKGSTDGVKKDMFVLDKNGYLVGRVIGSITPKECRVQLITDQDSAVGAYFEKGKPFGIIFGESGSPGRCRLNYILNTEAGPEVGDPLFTTGLDGIYPPGIPIGSVVDVENTSGLFKSVKVQPFYNLKNLGRVAVISVDTDDFFIP